MVVIPTNAQTFTTAVLLVQWDKETGSAFDGETSSSFLTLYILQFYNILLNIA